MVNKIALIIPLHKQSQYWFKLLKAIELQSILPDIVYLILDRPKEEEKINIETLNSASKLTIKTITTDKPPSYIGNPSDDLFLTPYCRNMGIDAALSDECNKFIFIDGDCVPQNKLIESHLQKLNFDIPALTVGRRREACYRWQDRREFVSELSHLELFRKKGLLINSPELLKKSLIVWSCNIGMNLSSIRLVKKFNKRYYGRDEVFSSEFIGKWGGEDGFLGIQAHYCRIFINTIGEKTSGIEHIDHPRPNDKYTIKHMDFLNKQIEMLRQKVTINPLELDFFI